MKRKAFIILSVLALLFSFTFATGGIASADPVGTPMPGGSVDVVIIGSAGMSHGGTLPTSFSGITFTTMAPASVNAASLAAYDTALLAVGSSPMGCTTATLTASQKADLVAFVNAGGKLIIYDSECTPSVDYSWLPYPFTTNNPGPQGARGILYIVENNCLSSDNPGDPEYIDYAFLGSNTDAVGDMNVMTTYDPHWCLDMSGNNTLGFFGPTHTYARYGAGLMIYNGLDMDDMGDGTNTLAKIWELELRAPFNPSPYEALPCGVVVSGLTLLPQSATNCVDTDHTLTARVTNSLGDPVEGVAVNFTITSGPNAPLMGGPVATDANGEATWTYTGSGGTGTDIIIANAQPDQVLLSSQEAEKIWEECGEPPVVEVGGTVHPVNKFMLLTPWITLGILLAAWGTFILRRRKAQS